MNRSCPAFAETVVVVAGLHGLGAALNDTIVHRPEAFAELSGLKSGEVINPEALARVLMHDSGGLRGIPQQLGALLS